MTSRTTPRAAPKPLIRSRDAKPVSKAAAKPVSKPAPKPAATPAGAERVPLLCGPDRSGNYYWRPTKRFKPEWRDMALGKDRAAAEAEARELNRQAQAWAESAAARGDGARETPAQPRRAARPSSVGELIGLYRARGMDHMAASTRREALHLLLRIEDRFGHHPPAGVARLAVRRWLDEIGASAPQSRRQIGLRFRALWNWGLSEELITAPNPFGGERLGRIRLGSGNRRKVRAGWEDVRALVAAADALGRPEIGDIMVVAFACVMRLTDAVALTGRALARTAEGGWRLRYRQSKRGAEIDMALPAVVAERLGPERLAALAGRPDAIAPDRRAGRPFGEEELARQFRAVKALARQSRPAIAEGLHLRDMRRSGFVAYVLALSEGGQQALGGRTPVELVCSISGHSIKDGYAIVEHYLPKTAEQADAAVARLTLSL